MKQAVAIFLLLCISYQFVAKVGIIAWYKVNQQYVSQQLCENRDKPKLHCNCKCYLRKQLAKVGQDTQQQPIEQKKAKAEFTDFMAILPTRDQHVFILGQQLSFYSRYVNTYFFTPTSDIFHPPSASAMA